MALYDFLVGGVIGAAQTVVGHPLDTMKVLLQSKRQWKVPLTQYYRGAAYPFFSSIFFNACVFPIYHRSLKYTESHFLAGASAGVASPVVYLFDLAKIKRQVNKPISFSKGLLSTCMRESLAMGLYFGSYHALKDKFNIFFAGGFAGVLSWTLTYPLDTVRTRQLSDNVAIRDALHQGKLFSGFSACIIRAFVVNSLSFYIYEKIKL